MKPNYARDVSPMTPSKRSMTLECVTVCVEYADFLAHTLPLNKPHFDRMVVVTSPLDHRTQKLCEYWHVECVVTTAFHGKGEDFNKGRGINAGLRALSRSDWLVHMDADIVLPPQFRQVLERLDLDRRCIYGIDRLMCESYEDWQEHFARPALQHECEVYVHLQPFEVGTRIFSLAQGGYVPIGFFQMWHASSGKLSYPEQHTDAGRTDMLFACQWPRSQRSLLPEIVGYHLATPGYGQGVNWKGRVTEEFGLKRT